MTFRVGSGFDVHRFSADAQRRLVLGGVEIAGEKGLEGHSDADVVAHAVADAFLGAAGLGDLGSRFPVGDDAWAGADSLELLRNVAAIVCGDGWTLVNADCNVVLDAPAIGDLVAEMAKRLTAAAGAPVSVKAKRAEGVGALGRGEGIAAWSVALIERA